MGLAYFPRLSPFSLPLVSFQVYLYLLISVSTHFLTPVESQTTPTPPPLFSPIAVSNPAYVRSVNKLYVTGGESCVHSLWTRVNQTMALDLAISWNSTSPAWIKLKDGPIQTASTAAFSSDEQTLYTFNVLNTSSPWILNSNSPWIYNVQNDTWRESTALKFESTAYNGITAVTDPRTGLIFLAGGYEAASKNSPYMKLMDVVDPITQTSLTIELPDPQTFFSRAYYGSVWSKYRSSIIYWGGINRLSLSPAPAENSVTELITDSMSWSTLIVGAPLQMPQGRFKHCMATNEDGTIVVIYGGILLNGTTVGDLWTLDLITLTWSQGPSGLPRERAACTVVGNYLLVWGGMAPDSTMFSTEMLIYNLNTSSYETRYTPPANYTDLTPPSPLTRTKAPWDTGDWPKSLTSSKGLGPSPVPIGAIAGGIVGGLVLIGVTVGILLIRRRRKQGEPEGRKELRDNNTQRGLKGLLGHGGGRGLGKRAKNNPQESNEDDELERTLQELQDQEKQLKDQKKELADREKELDQKRQLLVLQHQESKPRLLTDQKRGPSAVVGDKEEIFPLPPPRLSPGHVHSTSYSPESLNDRRTVQAVPGPIDMYQRESYADDGPRRESELVQDVIEPLYGPSPTICNSIPDLVYEPSPDVGMEWTKQQQGNHPHAVVDPYLY